MTTEQWLLLLVGIDTLILLVLLGMAVARR